METCEKCKKATSECECEPKKILDEEDVLEEEAPKTDDDPEEPEGDPEEPEEELDDPEEPNDPDEPESDDWQELAKKAGWVPDHVREKHAREAQTLRDQVSNLQTIIQRASEPVEEVDENEVVRQGDLARHLENLQANIASIQDPAIMSEMVLRQSVPDYDEVVVNNLEPFAQGNPWVQDILRGEPNPAKAAYDLGTAIRDGRKFSLGFKDGKPSFVFEDAEPKPKKKDPKRPDPKALERSQKQPKSLDEIPTATSAEAAEMSVEDFWKLPTDTLMRIRIEKPELYEKMNAKFHEKHG